MDKLLQAAHCQTSPLNPLGKLVKTPLKQMSHQGSLLAGGLLGGVLLRNPLALLAGGIAGGLAAGYLLHKYEKEIVQTLSKATGMGKDFVLHQRETLEDLLAEAHASEAGATNIPNPVTTPAVNPAPKSTTQDA
jgi:hypothetical protein